MTTPCTDAGPYWDLVEQSLEEAEFLWKRWEADLSSLTRNLAATSTWTEERLHGALDGVRIAGERIVEVAAGALGSGNLAAQTVAAHLLASADAREARAALAVAVQSARGASLQAMARGIETAALDGTFAPVARALAASGPEHSAVLCRIKAFRRVAPGPEALEALHSTLAQAQAQTLEALGRAAETAMAERYVTEGLRSSAPAVRQAAITAGIRCSHARAWRLAVELIEQRHPDCAPLLSGVAALGSPEEQSLVIGALRAPTLQTAGLFALAYIGTPQAVQIALAGMREPQLARAAGEAYCAITGAELVRDQLAAPEPPEAASPPPLANDPLDVDLVPRGADLWPLPDPAAVQRHWQRIKSQFAEGVRHWRGQPVTVETLVSALESGPMLRRDDLALELTVRTGRRYDLEPRAFAHVQRAMMRSGRQSLAERAVR